MRSSIIGGFFAHDLDDVEAFVRASTELTHTDPRAVIGARVVARVTAWIVRDEMIERPDVEEFVSLLESCGGDDGEWSAIVLSLEQAARDELSVEDFADALGLSNGVSGYIYHTVPVAVYAWYRHFGDYERTVSAVIKCGGDSDTTGAIAGALAGVTVGERGLPKDWLEGIKEWPRTTGMLGQMGSDLAVMADTRDDQKPLRYFWPGCVLRNLFLLAVVLIHGFRRLLPPY